jgi:hypothetical protein
MGQESIEVKITPEHNDQPLHIKHFERIEAALKIRMCALKTPRGLAAYGSPTPHFSEPDDSEVAYQSRSAKRQPPLKRSRIVDWVMPW